MLADIGMPGQDGYALIRTIRQLPESELRGIPAVAVTAYASAVDRGLALAAGFDRYVTKPINPSELVELIVSIAGRA